MKPRHTACPGRPAAARAHGTPCVPARGGWCRALSRRRLKFRRYHCEPGEALHRILGSFRHLACCSLQQREQVVVGAVRLRRAANNLILVSRNPPIPRISPVPGKGYLPAPVTARETKKPQFPGQRKFTPDEDQRGGNTALQRGPAGAVRMPLPQRCQASRNWPRLDPPPGGSHGGLAAARIAKSTVTRSSTWTAGVSPAPAPGTPICTACTPTARPRGHGTPLPR